MCEELIGVWELKDADKDCFDKYMKALGVGFATRKAGALAKPNVIISKIGDEFCLKTESSLKTTELMFKLGEEFDETTADNRKTRTLITCDDGVLTQVQKWDGKETTIKRELKNGQLLVTCTMGDVKCVRTYDKLKA